MSLRCWALEMSIVVFSVYFHPSCGYTDNITAETEAPILLHGELVGLSLGAVNTTKHVEEEVGDFDTLCGVCQIRTKVMEGNGPRS